ncbi:hypothetical protein KR009_007001 [Drosophila setifemur]|nr:hypothetical protein KR009_007001 [Drosophila setifemur]
MVYADNVFCQYDLSSYYYKNSSQFFSWSMDSRLCTHLVFGYGLAVDGNTSELQITDTYLLLNKEFLNVSQIMNGSIKKVMFTVNVWEEEEPKRFSKMVSSSARRDKFYSSLIDFMYHWHFDGVQIDWRYPTQRSEQSEVEKNILLFLEELGLIFQEHKFLLMVAVSGRTDKQTLEYYNSHRIANHVDFVNLILHDDRDPYSLHLSYNAPLYGSENSVAAAVKHWVEACQSPKKLILSIPFYVRSYTMEKNRTSVGSASRGPGRRTMRSQRSGFMTYGEWCVQSGSWFRKFDKIAMVPYATRDDHWVTYENARSIWAKMHLLQRHKLGGAMAWTIDVDDFLGRCGEPHGLLRIMYSALGDKNAMTTQIPTTERSGFCPTDGFKRDHFDCRLYHECHSGERVEYECLQGEYFDESLGICRPENEVKCEQNFVTRRPDMAFHNTDTIQLNLTLIK